MFEAVVNLCLLADPLLCRDILLPGYEAEQITACTEAIVANPPELSVYLAQYIVAAPHCRAAVAAHPYLEIAPGIFVQKGAIDDATIENQGDVANLGFLIGTQSVAVIDAGGSYTVAENLYRAIRRETDLPIRYVFLTHSHPDHIFGVSLFAHLDAQIVAHHRFETTLAHRYGSYLENFGVRAGRANLLGTFLPHVDITIDGSRAFDIGQRQLVVQSWDNAHSGTDITIRDPETGIVFVGDLIFDEHTPTVDASVLGWRQALTTMQAAPYTTAVPGHGGPVLDWSDAVDPVMAYLDVLITDTRDAIARGDSLSDAVKTIGQSEADNWVLFDLYNPRNATVAYTELEWE
ncbi:quinoprotein relay system zinc metallohydrolase 2 [Loktanella sp. S4079]|uniref:quinoprotein relay system zinc metallohydrolase 2 n=1 Tax=Loktanella sp. S4079 TaxID=579483 RepID=UPI0005FA0F42|nr:quinoprotein relay system zinc metallohydrolase 2 [Loktanella sp. S4079]KJZ18202.1 hypothetical protein TW80_14765 [Loktanella sp. S4079]